MPKMKLDAVSVTSRDMAKSVAFYCLLGFEFPKLEADGRHIEPITKEGDVRLMIDSFDLVKSILGVEPKPPTHSSFAMLCETPSDVDACVAQVKAAGFKVVKDPWDAFWGQRYAVLADPDGYLVDVFAWV